ncbi:rhodanese-like domain-containing protein [Mariniflexile sp.]|uniref:rhodanese-like domain-containing protein n=1 Tax=Mariniflexile sp. TaxID=1979402 RepID=UPI003562CB1A
MKKLSFLILGLLFIPTFLLTSCDRGDDPSSDVVATAKFTIMKDYMVQNNLDIDKILTNTDGESFVVPAPASSDLVDAFLSSYYIMDIRSAADYTTSHVAGAKNVAFSNILTEAEKAGTKPILVVCYTGQTACYATALLRMYGYSKTRALKWGMSGWNSSTANSWNNAIGNSASNHINWSYSVAPSNVVYVDPSITSQSSDGLTILKERVEATVALGFQTVKGIDVLSSPNNYFINNYFSETDYLGYGHIANAYRIKEDLLLTNNGYLGLNPSANAKVVTYCYTGQTSAVITACLRVLGYDAYSLTFGMNGLYNSNPGWGTSPNKWSASMSKNYAIGNN